MNQIKSEITPEFFKVWVNHTEHKRRDTRDHEIPIGKTYAYGIYDPDSNSYNLKKFHISSNLDPQTSQELEIQIFKAINELVSNTGKHLTTEDILPPSRRRFFDSIITTGHVRKDLPFGWHTITDRKSSMSRRHALQEKPTELLRDNRPQITRGVQENIWNLGDAIVRALRDPQGENPGDSRWTISGLSYSSWSISHPDLEILESGESPLTLRIKKMQGDRWAVFGQNQLKNLLNTKTLSIQKTPPDKDWDIDNIAKVAANYFIEQKDKIMELKQSMTPSQPPGAGATPSQPGMDQGGGPGGGMGGMPMAARRASATLGNLNRARDLVIRLNRRYGSHSWYTGSQVLNDRSGVGIRVRTASQPPRGLRSILEGIPVEVVGPGQARVGRQAARRSGVRTASEVFDVPDLDVPDTAADKEQKAHERRVKKVYNYLMGRKRLYGRVRYLAYKLKMDPHHLAKALADLIIHDKLDITNKQRKFKPIPTETKKATTSLIKIDKGNWRHNDQLDSQSTAQFQIFDAPEEDRVNPDARIMPDPTDPN